MRVTIAVIGLAAVLALAGIAEATTETRTSPTVKGTVPAGVTEIGGLVLDLVGANGTRVVSQLAASSLFIGFADDGTPVAYRGNPLTIGIQTGFIAAITDALGGGLSEVAVRMTLWDGDTAPGNFDDGDNTLLLNGYTMENMTGVPTQRTTSDGLTVIAKPSPNGFENEILCSGWFYSNNATFLANLFASMVSTQQVVFQSMDVDPYDNYYDFTQGIDGGLIDVGTGPVVNPDVPEPLTMTLVLMSLGGVAYQAYRRRFC